MGRTASICFCSSCSFRFPYSTICSGPSSPRKCLRISARLWPSRIKSNSSSVVSRRTLSRKIFHARRCAGWLSMITPSISNTTPRNIPVNSSLLVSGPACLRLLIVFHRANIDEVIVDGKSNHTAREPRQHVKPNISRSNVRDHFKQFRRADHQARECPIPGRLCRFFHELLNDSILISGHDAAAGGIRDLVDPESRGRFAITVYAQHAFEIGAVENVCVKYPEKIIRANPVAIGPQGSGAPQQFRFFHDAYRRYMGIASEEFADRLGMGMEVDHNLVDAQPLTTLEPKSEKRNALDWHQTFRNGVCDRTQASTMAGRQQERFHRWP